MTEPLPPLLKISVLHFRHPSKDEETWTKWYTTEQIPRFITVAHKHGIDRCEVVLTPSPFPLSPSPPSNPLTPNP